jgi:hypothetical protein
MWKALVFGICAGRVSYRENAPTSFPEVFLGIWGHFPLEWERDSGVRLLYAHQSGHRCLNPDANHTRFLGHCYPME